MRSGTGGARVAEALSRLRDAPKRRFDWYVMPVLAEERLVGRLPPRVDRSILSTGESAGRSRRAQAR